MITTKLNFEDVAALGDYLRYVPYDVSRKELYNAYDLYSSDYDTTVYTHFLDTGKQAFSAKESLARCLHDHCISHAMNQFLADFNPRCIVGIMGGHGLRRTDSMFRQIVYISKQLTEHGFLMISGGGPGAMEATHLGAWMAGRTDCDVESVLHRLSASPTFHDEGWLESALEVMRDYTQTRYRSLGIPTWLYGHEPSTPFATHIAKYFDNSIREATILTIAYGGIVYSPGSAGTMQEVFQEAVQDHYLSYGFASPMVFLGTDFWTRDIPVYPLLHHLMESGHYNNLLLTLTDSSDEVVKTFIEFRDKGGEIPDE